MIGLILDRTHEISVARQCQMANVLRLTAYYLTKHESLEKLVLVTAQINDFEPAA
jgi:hypothetical protein